MISFNCSCGKKYQLPDRNAGREVRCNQCQKNLIVPNQSQSDPVCPANESFPKRTETEAEKSVQESGIPVSPSKDSVSVPAPISPSEFSAKQQNLDSPSKQKVAESHKTENAKTENDKTENSKIEHNKTENDKTENSKIEHNKTENDKTENSKIEHDKTDQERAASEESSQSNKPSSTSSFVRFFAVMCIALLVGTILGIRLSPFFLPEMQIGNQTNVSSSAESRKLGRIVELIQTSVDANREKLKTKIADRASEVEQAVSNPDFQARRSAMQQIAKSRKENRDAWLKEEQKMEISQILLNVEKKMASLGTNGDISDEEIAAILSPSASFSTTNEGRIELNLLPIPFIGETVDGGPILVSFDKNPVPQTKDVLSELASTLGSENSANKLAHDISIRVDSASSTPLRLLWPAAPLVESDAIDASTIKEISFCIYIPDKINQLFKPTKPDGSDKVIRLAQFALRLHTPAGFVEWKPADMSQLASLCDQSGREWMLLSIPFDGNEQWKRTEHGISGDLKFTQIEIDAKPTGEGISFWIDNLKIEKK
ncbi:MAG: hypothetical protein ACRCUY_06025 [Thermoguttaceae bacterium]